MSSYERIARAAGPFAASLRPNVEGPALSAARLLSDPESLRTALDAMARRYPGGDLRGAASIWTKYYLKAVVPPPLAALVGGVGVSGDPAHVTVLLEDGLPAAAVFDPAAVLDATRCGADEAARRHVFESLLVRHLAPLFAAVQELTGLKTRVMWSNCGNLTAWLYRTLMDHGGPGAGAAARDAHDLMGTRVAPWFPAGNPLFEPVRFVRLGESDLPDEIQRRRVCCLRYLAGERYCYTCPIISLGDAKAILREHQAAG